MDVSKAEKQTLRYCDYYCFMSLADFMAWVDAEDGTEPEISYLTGSWFSIHRCSWAFL